MVRYLTAKEAAARLNVSVSTLYAYVSRGLIRSEQSGGNRRDKRYYAEDIQKLLVRKEGRQNPDRIAEGALQSGSPVLESAITLITDDCRYYRGHSALDLARESTVEQVAALIWTGNLYREIPLLTQPGAVELSPRCLRLLSQLSELSPVEIVEVLLPLAACDDSNRFDRHPDAVVKTGARILKIMITAIAGREYEALGLAEILQQAWAPDDPVAVRILNAALILYADHELNASAFTARCVASTGSTPYAVVTSALGALKGYKHGGASEQIEALFAELDAGKDVGEVITTRLRRGENIPGFSHVVYRDVDPRGSVLMQMLNESYPEHPAVEMTNQVIEEGKRLLSVQYNVDLALATLARVLKFPSGGAVALFALGRTIGWIGHALEQYRIKGIIRPRARYVGEQPVEGVGFA